MALGFECMNSTFMNQTVLECTTRCNVSLFEGVDRDVGKGMSLFIVGCLGLIGNILTIALIFSFKKRHVPDILVLSLAFNDIYSVVFPIFIALIAYFYPLRLPQGHWSCELMTLLSLLSRIMSMFLHTLIGIDRFLAIARPLQYRHLIKPITALTIIVAFFIVSLLISVIPWIYDATLDPDDPAQCLEHVSYSILNICLFDYTGWYPIIILFLGWGQMILFFVVFITTVTITMRYYFKRTRLLKGNDRILQEALNASKISRKDSKREARILKHITKLGSKMKERKLTEWLWLEFSFEFQFVRMLFLLSILFYLTWVPSLLIITYTIIAYRDVVSVRPDELIFWGIRISVLNIAINPIIYAIFSTQYRHAYWYAMKKYLFCCCKKFFTEDKISPFDRDEKRRQKKHLLLSGLSDVSGEVESDGPLPNFTRGAQAPGLATISENSLPKPHVDIGSDDERSLLPSYLSKKGRAIRFEDENSSVGGRTQETQETSVTNMLPPLYPDEKRVNTGALATEEGVSMFSLKRHIFEGFNVKPRQQLPKSQGRMTKLLSEKPKHKTVRVKGEGVMKSEQPKQKIHKTMPQIYASPYVEETDQLSSSPKLERTSSQRHKRPPLNIK